jgi:hypothetical protein
MGYVGAAVGRRSGFGIRRNSPIGDYIKAKRDIHRKGREDRKEKTFMVC